MKRLFSLLLGAVLVVIGLSPGSSSTSLAYSGIPTFSILSVVPDTTVTIQTYNFPPNDSFRVTMGAYGSQGIGGVVIIDISSGSGGSFGKSFTIPDSLKGSNRIAIRLQSPTSGYYAYNWFYNKPNAPNTSGESYSGYPWFTILAVERDKSVTIKAFNFPTNDSFEVTMGIYGTLGIGGVEVETTEIGSSSSFEKTYTVPPSLAGLSKIAIRLQSSKSGYFAYNWFYNNSTQVQVTPVPTKTPSSSYSGYPWIKIYAVKKDNSVTIQGYNFPPNDSFIVTMGSYGTKGIGGTLVSTTSTDGGGSFSTTYNIPAVLFGSYRIAIRLQSPTSGYYAYNWFYNNTTP